MPANPEIRRTLLGVGRVGKIGAAVATVVCGMMLVSHADDLASEPIRWIGRALLLAIICGALWASASIYIYLADRK